MHVTNKTYIGETKLRNVRLKDRFNEHRRPVDKQTKSSPQYQKCSLCNNHNATDIQLIPLELVQSNRDIE